MKRGDVIGVVVQGDFGKPRPAIVVQADFFDNLPSLTVLPLTTDLRELTNIRIMISPDVENGLRYRSQVMIDKISTVASKKIGSRFGNLSSEDMAQVDRALAVFLGFA